MIEGLFQHGAMPTLERMVQFTGERHRLLTHNIANLSTPRYRPADLSIDAFRASLRQAIDRRRESDRPLDGELAPRDTRDVRFHETGLEARPRQVNRNILFHDENNRDLDRTMQDLAENTLMHQMSVELLKNEFDMLKMAIRERL